MSANNESNQDGLDALARRVDALGELCQQLSEENADLRRQLSGGGRPADRTGPAGIPLAAVQVAADGGGVDDADGGGRSDRRFTRRNMVGLALGAAAATAVGAAVVEGGAKPAFAANGNAVVLGNVNLEETATQVKWDGSSNYTGVLLVGNDSTWGVPGAFYPAGIGGWAGAGSTAGKAGVANGVYGYTDNGGGNGVVGYQSGATSGSGAGVLGVARGGTNPGVQGINSSTAGSAFGVLGTISNASPGGFSAAVRGVNNGTGGLGIGVWGSHAGSGWGVYATSVSGVAVVASGGSGTGVSASGATGVSAGGTTAVVASGSTTGVSASGTTGVRAIGNGTGGIAILATSTATGATIQAVNSGSGHGIRGGSPKGRGGQFSGGQAQIQLQASGAATHPTSGVIGDLFVDKSGRLWFCKKTGNPATWKQIA